MGELIPVPEAAVRFGISQRTIRHLYDRGVLQLHKALGVRALLVDTADLEEALKQRRPRGRPPKPSEDQVS